MFDKEKFTEKMNKENDSGKELAAYLDCTPASLSNKLNGKQPWRADELAMIYERYSWTPVEFLSTFISKNIPNIGLLLPIEKQIIDFRVEN